MIILLYVPSLCALFLSLAFFLSLFPQQESGYKSKPVVEWDVEDVCQWLRDIGLGEHASMFEENEIIGEHLPDFGKDDLKELGVKKLGHQKTFISKLNLLL